MEYETVMLAGLLHDAGKFLQKGSFGNLDVKGKHPEVSARFISAFKETFARVCDYELLENLVMKHHEHPTFPEELRVESSPAEHLLLALLVSRADNYSSSERGSSAYGQHDYQTRPLDSVFCRLDIGETTPEILSYRAGLWSVENTIPEKVKANSEKELNNLLQSFGREFKTLADEEPGFIRLYTGLYALFLKYAWCIPSNSQEKVADVSLFDHLKTTSAIASCLYLYHKDRDNLGLETLKDNDTEKFILIAGDISGIQNYIFSGISIGSGGMARKLRARSFIISMYSELAAQQIIRWMKLPVANIIMSSGGKFYVLLPNTETAVKSIRQLQIEVDEWFLNEYQGELALNLAWHRFPGSAFNSFGSVTEAVNIKLAQKKQQPFKDVLQDGDDWLEERFIFDVNDRHGLGPCRGCGREFALQVKDDIALGQRCLGELELGRKIPRTAYLQLSDNSGDVNLAGVLGVSIIENVGNIKEEGLVLAINESTLPAGVAALPRELANYVPTENGQVITFDEIARLSRGIKRLGLLKADVDNLGKIFAFGLKRDDQSLDSISRMSTLSRMLDHFFSGCVNALLKDNYPTCYTVYSGGDDLVIIGPWDQVVGLAAELQARFRQFVADNSNITISAGIAMTRSRSPVNKAIEAAETMLELSKEKENPFTGKNRNQISIYRKNMTWESFSVIIGEGERLAGWAGGKKISSSELRNLKQYDLLYRDYIDHNNVQGLLYKAFLAYQLGRMKKEGKTDSVVLRWHEELLGETDAKLENLGPSVDYALSIIREGDY